MRPTLSSVVLSTLSILLLLPTSACKPAIPVPDSVEPGSEMRVKGTTFAQLGSKMNFGDYSVDIYKKGLSRKSTGKASVVEGKKVDQNYKFHILRDGKPRWDAQCTFDASSMGVAFGGFSMDVKSDAGFLCALTNMGNAADKSVLTIRKDKTGGWHGQIQSETSELTVQDVYVGGGSPGGFNSIPHGFTFVDGNSFNGAVQLRNRKYIWIDETMEQTAKDRTAAAAVALLLAETSLRSSE